MRNYLLSLWLAVRRWPVYAALVALGLAAFTGAGLRGYRLLGDDNERGAADASSGPHGGSHGGHGVFYHK